MKSPITNEEKAKEIAQSVSFFWTNEDDCEKSIIDTAALRKATFNAALQAMQLKDEQHKQEKQQWIDKAAEWIDNNVNHYIFENEYGETYIKYTFTEDFINAMKGE